MVCILCQENARNSELIDHEKREKDVRIHAQPQDAVCPFKVPGFLEVSCDTGLAMNNIPFSRRFHTAVWVSLVGAAISLIPASLAATSPPELKALFKNPPREYSTGPLWVWNDMLTEDQIRDTLRDLAGQKVKQVWVHPRPGSDDSLSFGGLVPALEGRPRGGGEAGHERLDLR